MYYVLSNSGPMTIYKLEVQGYRALKYKNKLVVFNHRVGYLGCIRALETVVMRGVLCITQLKRQLPSSSYNHNMLTTLKTFVGESLQMHT